MKRQENGQSLVEVLIAVAIGAILITAGIALIVPSLQANTQAAKVQVASSLGKELLDNLRAWSEGSWNNILSLPTGSANRYYLDTAVSPYVAVTGTESIVTSPVASGLVGWWKFDEGSGTVVLDSSGNNATGSWTGTFGNQWAAGKVGPYAGNFNGTNNYVNVGNTAPFNLSKFTVSFWWNAQSLSSWAGPFNNRVSSQNGFQVVNDVSSGSSYTSHLVIWNGSVETAQFKTTTSYAVPFSGYMYFTWTYDGTNAQLYVNGVAQPVSTSVVTSYPTAGVLLSEGYGLVGGLLDDVRVYNRALSATEVSQLYNQATYLRYFYLSDVFRDTAGNLSASTATYDPSTKKVTVTYNWLGGPATNTMTTYLIRSKNSIFYQGGWSGGPGQNGPVTSTNSQFASSSNIDYTTSTGAVYVSIPGY